MQIGFIGLGLMGRPLALHLGGHAAADVFGQGGQALQHHAAGLLRLDAHPVAFLHHHHDLECIERVKAKSGIRSKQRLVDRHGRLVHILDIAGRTNCSEQFLFQSGCHIHLP